MNIIEHTSHPSAAQVEALVEIMEQNPSLAKGFSKTQSGRIRAHRDWDRITLKLNSISGGTIKTPKKWIKYWADKKSAVKKKATAYAAASHKIDADIDFGVPELSTIEERIIAVMSGNGFGNNGIRQSLLLQVHTEDVAECTRVSGDVESPKPEPSCFADSPRPGPFRLREPSCTSHRRSVESQTRLTANASTPWRRKFRSVQTSSSLQRCSQFVSISEKFLKLEEQRLAIHQQIASTLERNAERDIMMAEATKVLGEGLKALAEAIKEIKR